jgi:sulfite reductase (ferredoxin)
VTACPLAGVCHTEAFDVTPYSKQMMLFMLGHPDTIDFGRKFKIAFSGCAHEACALVSIHDLGLIAVKKTVDGKEVRGFDVYVGGGLGAVPFQAKLLAEFVEMKEILPLTQAISRVFARLGEKKNRQKARLKFVVQKLGIGEFKRIVYEERKTVPYDPRWDRYGVDVDSQAEQPVSPPTHLNGHAKPEGFEEWFKTNVYLQRQKGYAVATVTMPLGDMSTDQARALAVISDRFGGGNLRTTIEQNIVLRWVSEADLPSLYAQLKAIGLGQPGAGTIVDVTSCPGTDTCKLGIASSRGLAGELRDRLALQSAHLDEAVKGLRIKISGCFNSCGQHHVADIGFYGNSRNLNGYTVPHFQVMLGGKFKENAASYGQAIGAIPSKAIPEVVKRLLERYVKERTSRTEGFHEFTARLGKKELKAMFEDLTAVPPYVMDSSYYSDWGDPREFTIGDMGMGECAGEIVTLAQFGFTAAESQAFEAQLKLEAGDYAAADQLAYKAMLEAAKTLVKIQFRDVPDTVEAIVSEFRTRYVEPKIFWDKYHHGQFGNYLFGRFENPPSGGVNKDWAHRIVDEANLFVDAAHSAHAKILAQQQADVVKLGA